jgi:hypothetical protein
MRIKWQDSREYKTYTYRGYTIEKIIEGWITNIPGDEYIYYSAETAHNAVDKILGGKTRKANPARHKFGVKIVGKKAGDHSCA